MSFRSKKDIARTEDGDLGFALRCMAADAIDMEEGKGHGVFPDEINLHHLDPEYIVTVKLSVKKKPDAKSS